MSADPVLVVEGIHKTYRRGVAAYGSLRDVLHGLVRGRGEAAKKVDALADVSLALAPGEATGVVGPNGAGKSTLLKVIARITPPDRGRVEVRGRLSALIEVGAGFHPELTGRENVLLHGSILGLGRRALGRRMGEIAAFAGLEDAMDVPVKQFSTGMYARLGFAVAVHADPALLLVDEVLSVGDRPFRDRCHARIEALLHGGGAVLLVSHDHDAVRRLCGQAIRLEAGRVVRQGDPASVLDA